MSSINTFTFIYISKNIVRINDKTPYEFFASYVINLIKATKKIDKIQYNVRRNID